MDVIYGPYFKKSKGRWIVQVHHNDGTITERTYARVLMEEHLGRKLHPIYETVDHINEDKTDDRIENLQLLTLRDNLIKSNRLQKGFRSHEVNAKGIELIHLTCIVCQTDFSRPASRNRRNNRLGQKGPFCSKSCAATYRWSKSRRI